MNAKKLLALLLALVMVLSLVACGGNKDVDDTTPTSEATDPATDDTQEPTDEATEPTEARSVEGAEFGVDYTSLYKQFGKDITVDQVIEDTATGLAYINVDGVDYELGLDFLTMAMVYNISVPEGGIWETEDDVYATWWKLYIQRWNYLLPEVPLYSNEYYDLYNAQIKGVTEYPTNPYWSPASALIDWTSEKEDGSIILGSSTELSGKFNYASFGASSPGSADLDIQNLIVGLETIATTKEGGYQWNDTVVESHEEVDNDDGSKTYTIKIYDDMTFSDGTPVTAKNYLVRAMIFSSPVGAEAASMDHMAGQVYVGFADFNTYDGTEGSGSKEFTGLRLIDDYTFSVTVDAEYNPYFYAITYAGFSASDLATWIGDADILDDGNGVYFTDDFYAKDGDSYTTAATINAAAWSHDPDAPYSGPYTISEWDEADKSVVLTANPNFKGNYEGTKPGIEKVVYKRIVSETQMADFKSGGVDVLSGITGGDATKEAIAEADASEGKFVYTHYSRAGYGKLGFRCDFGPAQFTEVRQAVAYCMDRATFAKEFTGGYGGVVDGPYYTGSWMYKAAVEQGMVLNAYATSADSAIAVLEEGGWIYNAEGGEYTEGVRYKKLAASAPEKDKTYSSKDGTYKTVEIDGEYYMPLVLNWYGTSDNEFTDLLMTGFMENENIKTAGMVVQNNIGDFSPMLDELYQQAVYGYYGGTPMYSCFNFATGFTSAAYDYAYYMTIDPDMYDNWSQYYIKDTADIFWLN